MSTPVMMPPSFTAQPGLPTAPAVKRQPENDAHLIPANKPHQAPFQDPVRRTLMDWKLTAKALSAVQNGQKSTDYQLAHTDDTLKRLGGFALAGLAGAVAGSRIFGINEFLGFGAWFGSMSLGRIFVDKAFQAKTGLNTGVEYVSSYENGQRKALFMDPGYMPNIYTPEQREKLLRRNGRTDEQFDDLLHQVASQRDTWWMLTAGFMTPLLAGAICDSIQHPVHKAFSALTGGQLAGKLNSDHLQKDLKAYGDSLGRYADHVLGNSADAQMTLNFWLDKEFLKHLKPNDALKKAMGDLKNRERAANLLTDHMLAMPAPDRNALKSYLQAQDQKVVTLLQPLQEHVKTYQKTVAGALTDAIQPLVQLRDHNSAFSGLTQRVNQTFHLSEFRPEAAESANAPKAVKELVGSWRDLDGRLKALVAPSEKEVKPFSPVDHLEDHIGSLEEAVGNFRAKLVGLKTAHPELSNAADGLLPHLDGAREQTSFDGLKGLVPDVRKAESIERRLAERMTNARFTTQQQLNVLGFLDNPETQALLNAGESGRNRVWTKLRSLLTDGNISTFVEQRERGVMEPALDMLGKFVEGSQQLVPMEQLYRDVEAASQHKLRNFKPGFEWFGASPAHRWLDAVRDDVAHGKWAKGVYGGLAGIAAGTALYVALMGGSKWAATLGEKRAKPAENPESPAEESRSVPAQVEVMPSAPAGPLPQASPDALGDALPATLPVGLSGPPTFNPPTPPPVITPGLMGSPTLPQWQPAAQPVALTGLSTSTPPLPFSAPAAPGSATLPAAMTALGRAPFAQEGTVSPWA